MGSEINGVSVDLRKPLFHELYFCARKSTLTPFISDPIYLTPYILLRNTSKPPTCNASNTGSVHTAPVKPAAI